MELDRRLDECVSRVESSINGGASLVSNPQVTPGRTHKIESMVKIMDFGLSREHYQLEFLLLLSSE